MQAPQLDAATIEVIRNYMLSAARQMRNTLVRASCSPVIYEIIDFSQGLYNARADLIAEGPGLPHFMGTLRFAILKVVEYIGEENIKDGDVLLSTYPYWTGSHSQDAVVIRPIFIDGKIFSYAASKAHWMDIGAKDVYGTNTTDIWQEGLQIYGARVRCEGVPNREIIDIVRANSRLPDSVVGDLNAQIASCEQGAQRVVELVQKYCAPVVVAAFEAILDHGERITRQAIREAPDGEWSAQGFLDNNGVTRERVAISLTVRIEGDELTVDTTGSAIQQAGPTNAPLTATIAFARLALKRLTTPNFEANEGCFRPLKVVAPLGSIFNSCSPAPVFQYGHGPAVMGELLMMALSQAMPSQTVARSGSSECAFLFSGIDPDRNQFFAGADIDGVGQGASRDADGESALIVYFGGDGRNLPIEVLESRFPVLSLSYELRPDSAGAGQFRGGLGVVKMWRALADLRCITVVEQTDAPPEGLFGGGRGLPNLSIMNADTDRESRIGKQSDADLPAGAEWHLFTGGGGGWGDSMQRDLAAVLDDLTEGYISPAGAEKDYGVVRQTDTGFVLNWAATDELRGRRRAEMADVGLAP